MKTIKSIIVVLIVMYFVVAGSVVSAQPANDDFDNATLISSLPFTDNISTADATSASDDPWECYTSAASVWYSFTPTADMQIEANTIDSNYDTVLSVDRLARCSFVGRLQ